MSWDVKRKFSASTYTYISAIDFHPTQPWLLTGDRRLGGNVTIYNLESGKVIHSFSPGIAVQSVKFIAHKNCYIVISCEVDASQLCIFDCTTHEEILNFKDHDDRTCCLAVHPTFSIIIIGSNSGTITARDWDKQWEKIHTYEVPVGWVTGIAFNPKDHDTFAAACYDGAVRMWSISSATPHITIQAHSESLSYVSFYPGADKPYLITVSHENTVKLWDYLSQTCVQTIEGYVFFAAFHPSLPVVLTASADGLIKVRNYETLEVEHSLDCQLGFASCITFHEDTSEVAVGALHSVVTFELAHSGPAVSRDQVTKSLDSPDDVDPYQQCSILALDLMAAKATNKLISELGGDKAQYVADFLSKMVSDETFAQRDRKRALHLLSKLAKSAVVFPKSLVLEGTQCDLDKPVAWGGYGVIYKGLHGKTTICVKAVQTDSEDIDDKKLRAHASELTIWANLEHLNILPFLGIYASKEEVPRICIVSPWMNNGDLLQYLKKVPEIPRKPLVHDIISGLLYLHDLDIVHADLKAKNVLVSETGRAMLADFGISRLSMTQTTTLTNVGTGTVYWMAPELLLEQKSPSYESDIWAFACTCYEIITRTMPFSEYYNIALLIGGFVMKKFSPKKATPGIGWDEDIWSVAMRCWQGDPSSRPSAQELLDMIDRFDYTDNRSSNSESRSSRSPAEIDYDRVLSILDAIRQSAAV